MDNCSALFKLLILLVTVVSWCNCSPDCKGYILALKVVQVDQPRFNNYYNHVSLFNISLDGQVTRLWNISLAEGRLMFSDNGFAVDKQRELVYISVVNQFLAVDLYTGKTVIDIPLDKSQYQRYINYRYSPADGAFYGVCGTGQGWWWCRTSHKGNRNISQDYLFQLPFTNGFGPVMYVYDVDIDNQLLWYEASYLQSFIVGVDSSTGKTIYVSGPSNASCTVYDPQLNRTFGITQDIIKETVYLTESHPRPTPDEVLLKLPSDLRLDFFGVCVYDHATHTLIGLMGDMNLGRFFYHSMPTELLLVDVVGLRYRRVPLPGFKEWDSGDPITAVRLIQN